MKNRYILIPIVAAIMFFTTAGAFAGKNESSDSIRKSILSEGAKKIQTFKYPPLLWRIPEVGKEVKKATLDNGMIVYLMEDNELPIIDVNLIFPAGTVNEIKEIHGIAEITASMLRTGGTKNRKPDQLDKDLEFIGAQLTSASYREKAQVSLNLLSRDIDRGLDILADVVMNPAFQNEKLDFTKSQIRERLMRKNDNPSSIASREFFGALFGDHPYGWGTDLRWSVVKEFTTDDCFKWYNTTYAPQGAYIAVSGDFKSDWMLTKLNGVLGKWKKESAPKALLKEPLDVEANCVNFIQKDISQSIIYMGHLGTNRYNPDNYAIKVMNSILGVSRMMTKVRSDKGLAYIVYSWFNSDYSVGGTFFAFCQTKSETTFDAMDLMKKEIIRMQSIPVTEAELKSAKDSLVNRYIFNFSDSSAIVRNLANLEYEAMPADYYKTYAAKIEAVTAADVKRVAKKYLHPDRMLYLVVGDRKHLGNQLKSFGEIKEIQLEEMKD